MRRLLGDDSSSGLSGKRELNEVSGPGVRTWFVSVRKKISGNDRRRLRTTTASPDHPTVRSSWSAAHIGKLSFQSRKILEREIDLHEADNPYTDDGLGKFSL
ncbi:hypothetical protein RSSM_04229 [Rhodopirellula sallentina SM41]|uniref:Uncharacterized protein n=1 Tax=Rhodopirellula sallentina SM41 TaxID=1263870 RepID=M5UE86_9BACT|nr:hypothetical protein RSSM_04229 [Rhodopirellula sallentina SM41]